MMMNNMDNNNINLTERPLTYRESQNLAYNTKSIELSRSEYDALASSGILTIPGILICIFIALKFFGIM